jgi:hypothetical protein
MSPNATANATTGSSTDSKASAPYTQHMLVEPFEPPPFWENKPSIWFTVLESNFTIDGVTADDFKYSYVVISLSEQQMHCVRDIVISPPPTDKYETLKQALTERYSDSQNKQLQQQLYNEELGNKTSTQLLDHSSQLTKTSLHNAVTDSRMMSRNEAVSEQIDFDTPTL